MILPAWFSYAHKFSGICLFSYTDTAKIKFSHVTTWTSTVWTTVVESSGKLWFFTECMSANSFCLCARTFYDDCSASHKGKLNNEVDRYKNYFVKGKPSFSRSAREWAVPWVLNFTVTWRPCDFTTSSCGTSGKMVCSLIPKLKFPSLSNPRPDTQRKSRTRGRTMAMSFSRKAYILSPRSVTIIPTGIPFLSLKFEIASREWLIRGSWPAISARSFLRLEKSLFPAATKLPIPILRTIFSILGICIAFSIPSSASSGRIFFV